MIFQSKPLGIMSKFKSYLNSGKTRWEILVFLSEPSKCTNAKYIGCGLTGAREKLLIYHIYMIMINCYGQE